MYVSGQNFELETDQKPLERNYTLPSYVSMKEELWIYGEYDYSSQDPAVQDHEIDSRRSSWDG